MSQIFAPSVVASSLPSEIGAILPGFEPGPRLTRAIVAPYPSPRGGDYQRATESAYRIARAEVIRWLDKQGRTFPTEAMIELFELLTPLEWCEVRIPHTLDGWPSNTDFVGKANAETLSEEHSELIEWEILECDKGGFYTFKRYDPDSIYRTFLERLEEYANEDPLGIVLHVDSLFEAIKALEDYCILDEDLLFKMESEATSEAFEAELGYFGGKLAVAFVDESESPEVCEALESAIDADLASEEGSDLKSTLAQLAYTWACYYGEYEYADPETLIEAARDEDINGKRYWPAIVDNVADILKALDGASVAPVAPIDIAPPFTSGEYISAPTVGAFRILEGTVPFRWETVTRIAKLEQWEGPIPSPATLPLV